MIHVQLACSKQVKNYEAVKILLSHVYVKEQKADWNDLDLCCLQEDWFQSITISSLCLSHNKIKSFPANLSTYLKNVVDLNLKNNKLQSIPPELLMLPKLTTLNLSSNQINHLPNVKKWPIDLQTLNLEDNCLRDFPENVDGLLIKNLNIAGNQLNCIPNSIFKLTHLVSLNISRNSGIHKIPAAIGEMATLDDLVIKDLKVCYVFPLNKLLVFTFEY